MSDSKTYNFVLFKLKGHNYWRITQDPHVKKTLPGNVSHAKMLEIDRVTGELKLFKLEGSPE